MLIICSTGTDYFSFIYFFDISRLIEAPDFTFYDDPSRFIKKCFNPWSTQKLKLYKQYKTIMVGICTSQHFERSSLFFPQAFNFHLAKLASGRHRNWWMYASLANRMWPWWSRHQFSGFLKARVLALGFPYFFSVLASPRGTEEVNVGSVCHPVLLGLVMPAKTGDTNNKIDAFI